MAFPSNPNHGDTVITNLGVPYTYDSSRTMWVITPGGEARSGYSGATGNQGSSGYSGAQGASGVSGYSGISGTDGASGFSGIDGQSGFSGYSGTNGSDGDSGYSGTNGSDGASGYSGTNGSDGSSGYSGTNGSNGSDGASGYSGTNGSEGASGFSGYSGVGTSGYSGAGLSGFSGYSGQTGESTSGFSGYSGTEGASGYSGSGVSGWSGYSGTNGVIGGDGASGYSGSGVSGFSGYSGAGISGWSGYSGFGSVLAADTNKCGFLNQTETTIAFDGTSIFTLGDAGAGWSYYRAGVKYTISGSKQIDLLTVDNPLVNGSKYFIYIDSTNGTLGASTVPWTLLDTKIPVAIVSWYGTSNPKYILQEERHTVLIDRRDHYYLHSTRGTAYSTGGELTGYTPNTNTDAANTFAVAQAVIEDEDIILTLPQLDDGQGLVADNYSLVYRVGASTWTWASSDMPFSYTPSGYINWDNGGTIQQGTGGAGGAIRYYNTYLIFTNASGAYRHVIVPGQGEFTTTADAYAESFSNFTLTNFPKTEWVAMYQLTWRTGAAGLTNKGKCQLTRNPQRIVASAISVSQTSPVPHNNLSGLQGGAASEYYHLTSAEYTALQLSGGSGYSGYSGSVGTSGFSGYSGSNGSAGDSGFSGYSGTSGYSGYSGTSGYSGKSGWSGRSGYSGVDGTSGFSGYSGTNGSVGTSGFSGYSGSNGSTGTSGFSGYSGSGISGYSGAGISGFSGYSGTNGSAGTSGFSGYSGTNGSVGTSGFSGYSGVGTSGFSGYSGVGTSGFSGYSGTGTSGFSGYSGVGTSGFSGYSGVSGYSGRSGYSGVGTSGYSGVGTSGFSGYSGTGTSGFSGYSGAVGTSGYSGTIGTLSRGGVMYNTGGVSGSVNVITWYAPYACTVTNVRGYRVGGTGATINARRNGTSNHLATALSLTNADTWTDGGTVQNTAYASGDKLEIMSVTTTGTVTQLAIQVDFTKP